MKQTKYADIGLKCGIEIHQQLEGSKLFCRCPAHITDSEDFEVARELHSVVGEQGQADVAALAAAKKQHVFTYSGSKDNNCLVDLDESPPLPPSQDALNTVLLFSKMVNAKPVDVAQVMRKIVVDGSNTSGFQRTALIARDGFVESSEKRVRIATVILEEDSAQKRIETPNGIEYNIDRLGIPLIEIGTEPDIVSPQHAQEVAQYLGMLLRSTQQVKRGQGTIRQDVNVSIRGGTRVEIKGAQDIRLVPTIVEEEIKRQQNLLAIKQEWTAHKCSIGKIIDISASLASCESRVISSVLDAQGIVLALKIKNAAGLLGYEVQSNRRFGSELSDYAKVAAGVKGLFHSDELPKYGITDTDVHNIRAALDAKSTDVFVLVAAQKSQAERALKAVHNRLHAIPKGVLKEVRNALANGSSEYMRPLPGAARMYPETDIPPISIDQKLFKSLQLPEIVTDRTTRYEKLGMSGDLARHAARSDQWQFIDTLIHDCASLKPAYIAEIVLSAEKNVEALTHKKVSISESSIKLVLGSLNAGKISKEAVLEILSHEDPQQHISKFFILSDTQLLQELKHIATTHKDTPLNALIGIAMKNLRGKASGEKIVRILRELF